jgi:hypothetical protein
LGFSVNNINPGSILPVTPAKTEAANSQAGNPGNVEVHPDTASRAPASSQAALVNLDKFITTGLDKLRQTMAGRSAMIDNLPPQLKELVKTIFKQAQSVQTTLPEGLTALLKSPQTAAEKLIHLAAALEDAAGLPGEKPAKAADTPAGKLPNPEEPASAWRNFSPEALKAAAKLLRELAAAPMPRTNTAAAGRQEPPAAVPPANSNPLPQPQSLTAAIPRPADQSTAAPQDFANLLKAALAQPELIKNLPPEIRKLLQTLLQQEEPPLTGQPRQTVAQAQPDALFSLVRPAQTAPERLALLAAALDQAAELTPPEGQQTARMTPDVHPDLTKAALALREKNPGELKTAAGIIRELAETMPRAGGGLTERLDNQRILTFTIPLYFGDGQTAYPAHIHLYHQKQEDKKNPGRTATETWLRICLETENLGLVETSFRLYDRDTVDVKVRFDDHTAAAGFAASADEVKAKLSQLPLTLGEFLVK